MNHEHVLVDFRSGYFGDIKRDTFRAKGGESIVETENIFRRGGTPDTYDRRALSANESARYWSDMAAWLKPPLNQIFSS